jgi:uncharacterized LabA/DUF88 family protein
MQENSPIRISLNDMRTQRVTFFIDGTNLSKGLKDSYGLERINIEFFCKYLARGRQTSAIYYAEAPYVPERGTNNFNRQQAYLNHIKTVKGLIYRKGYYSRWANPPVEKLTDVNLAVDMVDTCHRDEFDVAFVISGDADLCPAVDVLVREDKKVIIVYFDNAKRNAYALRKHAGGTFVNITKSIADHYKWEAKKEPEPFDPGGTMSKQT